VLIDGWLQAHITTPQDAVGWDDWFTWREEGTDWRRATPPPNAAAGEAAAEILAGMMPAKGAKRAKHEQPWPTVGCDVEVLMTDEGFQGSRYPARVLKLQGARVEVEYEGLYAEGAEGADMFEDAAEQPLLHEWIGVRQLAAPPPKSSPNFLCAAPIGTKLDMLHEGGWWPVEVVERRQAVPSDDISMALKVRAIGFDRVERWGGIRQFRMPKA